MTRSTFVAPQPSPLEIRYHHYLAHSWRWRIVRTMRLWLDGHRCQTCYAANSVQCHHASYKHLVMAPGAWLMVWSMLGEINDTIALCAKCHQAIHKSRSILDFAD